MELYELKPYLNISLDDSSYDALLTSLYESAKQIFSDMTDIMLSNDANYDFTYYNGNSVSTIFFNKGPVNSINSVTYRSNFSDTMTSITSSSYELSNSVIRFKNSWTYDKMIINVNIGYSTIPSNIEFLLAQIVNHFFNFQANNVHLSSDGNVPLMPNEAVIPRYLYNQIKAYELGL